VRAQTQNKNKNKNNKKEEKREGVNYSIRPRFQIGDLSVQGDLSTLYKSRFLLSPQSLQSPPSTRPTHPDSPGDNLDTSSSFLTL
jgi:hypothetical protein